MISILTHSRLLHSVLAVHIFVHIFNNHKLISIMKEEEKSVEQTENKKTKAPKRVVISISVTPEEKRKISVEALKDYETSVSDLIRSRMFIKPEEPKEDVGDSTGEDTEIEIYKEVIQDLKNEITELKESNLQLKLNENENAPDDEEDNSNEKETIEPTAPKENILFIEFEQEEDEKSIIQKIKEYRSELFERLDPKEIEDFKDFDKYSKTIFLRGLKRSYNNGVLNEGTGLHILDIQNTAKLEQIDYSDDV